MDYEHDENTAVTLPPFVEVELVYERGYVGMPTGPWGALEVWTRNRIYSMDWHMRCIEVVERTTAQPVPEHPLVGAYLSGGQKEESEYTEMTYPCPRPDTQAVFEHRDGPRKGFVHTSTVTRVVLRLRVLTVPREHTGPAWEGLSGSHHIGDLDNRG